MARSLGGFFPLPLAQQIDHLRQIGEHWNDAVAPLSWIAVAGGGVLILLGTLWLFRWWQHRNERSRPLQVFHATARRAGLSLPQQWLLGRIARQQRLPSPLTLLLSRRTLWRHGLAYARARPPLTRGRVLRRVYQIRRQLFGHVDGDRHPPVLRV